MGTLLPAPISFQFHSPSPPPPHCRLIARPLPAPRCHRRPHLLPRAAERPPASVADDPSPSSLSSTDDLQPLKFQPFVAHNELRRLMMSYRTETTTPDGRLLVVQPVSAEWLDPTADLLTEAFGETMGYYAIYRNFLRRQIKDYLRTRMEQPPKTICLVALLVSEEESRSSGKKYISSAEADAAVSQPESEEEGGAVEALGEEDECSLGFGDGMGIASTSSYQDENESGSDDNAASTSEDDSLPYHPQLTPANATLVGAVEVSFTESTRSKDLTGLNPPPERPYLCNMAVASSHRRRGIGAALLAAAEELVLRVGDNCVYLHLRFKDAPAAALYRKSGYESTAQDSIFVRLVGQDRRWLMRKGLSPAGGGAAGYR